MTGNALDHFTGYVREWDKYYQDRPEFHERLAIWGDLLDAHCPPGGFALDMGCGTGVFSFYLAKKAGRVIGIDGAPDMISFCEARRAEQGVTNLQFIEARLPAVDETPLRSADLLISSSVVEYVDDLQATLALFARLLKPGGTLILSMPNVQCINRACERLAFRVTGRPRIYRHIRHFTSPQRLRRQLGNLGLTIDEVRYYTHYTRLAKFTRLLHLPLFMTEDLFVVVAHKAS